ncbi:hypothetical protein JTB14_028821 [Gonioctena quinquepunctata]|nr:hypothetical protein JTB14_028821 [Gonioctena quinquepunctata]
MELNGSSDDVENSYNLGSFFFRCMSRHGNTISQYVADTGVENTYQELLTRSIRVALKLREKGIGKNDIVSTCTHNNEHSCLPTIATQYLGGITANFDPDLSHLDTIKLLELIRPKMMFVPKQCLGFMEECLKKANIETMIVVFGTATNYEQFSDYLEPHPLEENFKPAKSGDNRETAVIMFSSGTTGFPKAICLSHYSLLEFTKNNNISSEQLGGEIKVWLSYPSLYWISALVMLIRGTMNGYARVVSPAFEAVNTWKLIDEYMVNSIFLPPYQAADFLNKRPKNTDASSLEYLMTGTCSVSEKLMKDLKEALPNTVVVQGYGQTETAGLITNFDVSKPEELEFQNKKPASCGKIIGGIKWKVS